MPERVRVTPSCVIDADELEWRFTASGGPGGQHANTANTKVEVRFDVDSSPSLGPRQRARLVERLGPVVRVVASDRRSQAQNRELALERLKSKLAAAPCTSIPRVGPRSRRSLRSRSDSQDKRRQSDAQGPPARQSDRTVDADAADVRGAVAREPRAPAVDDDSTGCRAEERRERSFELIRVGVVDSLDRLVCERHLVRHVSIVRLASCEEEEDKSVDRARTSRTTRSATSVDTPIQPSTCTLSKNVGQSNDGSSE